MGANFETVALLTSNLSSAWRSGMALLSKVALKYSAGSLKTCDATERARSTS
jgi:hypothetical protein